MSNQIVAQTIIAQLGGAGRLSVMLGVKFFRSSDNGLFFRWTAKGRNGENAVRVTLNGSDLYDVEFLKVRGTSCATVSTFDDVYFDQLQTLFRDATGLAVRL
jgi:hypothetical protein